MYATYIGKYAVHNKIYGLCSTLCIHQLLQYTTHFLKAVHAAHCTFTSFQDTLYMLAHAARFGNM
jgi:hypothetical protein